MRFLFFGNLKSKQVPPAAGGQVEQQPSREETTPESMVTPSKVSDVEKTQNKADVSIRKEAEKVSSIDSSTKLDPKIVPEVPNLNITDIPSVVEPDPRELAEAESDFANHFSREYQNLRNYFAEEAPDLELNLRTHSPYIIGAMIAAPAYSLYTNMRKNGLIDFVHKTSTRSKILKLMIMSAGIAAYQYNKPQIKSKFSKEFKEA